MMNCKDHNVDESIYPCPYCAAKVMIDVAVSAASEPGIDATLKERGARYGAFEHHAKIAQDLQARIQSEEGLGRRPAPSFDRDC